MKKILVFISILILVVVVTNLCKNDKPSEKKEYIVTLRDGTVCKWFEVRYEMEMVSTTRKLKPEEYQIVADMFHFPRSKMVYFYLAGMLKDGEHYGTLCYDVAQEVKNFNPDSIKANLY